MGMDQLQANRGVRVCWLLLLAQGVSSVFLTLYPASAISQALLPAIGSFGLCGFVLLHASLAYGWRGLAILLPISFVLALFWENLSIATGFPFGFFTHSQSYGLKIIAVPAAVAIGYFFLGYLAWMLAKLIDAGPVKAWTRLTTPFIAAIILVGFDMSTDSIGATVQGFWTYRSPTGLFGVPLTNFLGWFVLGWTTFQCFALIEPRLRDTPDFAQRQFWAQPAILWALLALQAISKYVTAPEGVVTRGGRTWMVADIYEGLAIVAAFTMLLPVIIALSRLAPPAPAKA